MTWTYPAIMGLALFSSVALASLTRTKNILSRPQKWALFLGAFCGSMIAAKLPFALYDWRRLLDGSAWLDNGKTLTMGLVGGYLGVEIAKYLAGVTAKTGDGFAAPVALGVAVGRLACFAGGCCYGTACDLPWAVDFGDGVPRHPTQVYEFFFHFAFCLVLIVLQQRGLFRRQLMKLYVIGYMAYRFATEFIRPEPEFLWGLTAYQWAAVGVAALFAGLWAWDARATPVPATP